MTPDPITDQPDEPIQQTVDKNDRRSSSWDIKNAPRNYLSLVATHIATALFSFASVWLITQNLGAGSYGAVVAIVAASQLIQIFLNWSSTALTRFGIEEFVETGQITKTFWSRTSIFVPNLVIALILSYWWIGPVSRWLQIQHEVLWLIVVHIAATSVWLHVQGALQSVKMLRLQGSLLAVERCLTFTMLAILMQLGLLNLISAIWCYIIPAVLLSAAGAFRLVGFIGSHGVFSYEHLRKMILFSIPLVPFAIVSYLSTSQLDAFFITRYLTVKDLGIYAVAAQVNGILLQLPILANTMILSLFISLRSQGGTSALNKIIDDAVPTLNVFWSVFCAIVSFIGWVTFPSIFGEDFGESYAVLWILSSSSVCMFPVLMGLATQSNVNSKTTISMYASIASAITNVSLNVLLIPKFGLLGCAWASVGSAFVHMNLFYVQLRRLSIVERSWTHQSLLSSLVSSIVITFSGNVALALMTILVVAILFLVIHFDSFRITYELVKSRRLDSNI